MRFALLPRTASPDARRLILARGLRAVADGAMSLLLPAYLSLRGFGAIEIGLIATTTLLGSASLTLVLGFVAHRFEKRLLLGAAALLMLATGFLFAVADTLWPLLFVAFIGTLNPSSGDVSIFYPLEQTLLPQTVPAAERTALFARASLISAVSVSLGALLAGLPDAAASHFPVSLIATLQGAFVLYGVVGLASFWIYRRLTGAVEIGERTERRAALGPSRGIVFRLAALFSLDSFGGGLVVQSMLALWLYERFGLSIVAASTIFFWAGMFSALSFLAAPWLARRIGLVRTMAYTHLPANLSLALVPFMPTIELAIVFLLLRSALSQMDVPARSSYVMAIVTPEERPAAASVTALPRSLATAASPLLSGYLLALSPFGWPLVAAGGIKVAYDLLLLALFRAVRPPEEGGRS